MPHDGHHTTLTQDEIDEALEPIRDWGHCWGRIAERLIADEIRRKTEITEEEMIRAKVREHNKGKLGPYGDWPSEGG